MIARKARLPRRGTLDPVKMRPIFRRAVAFIALAMLVSMQVAVAAHLCAGIHAPAAMEQSADPCDSMQHQSVPPCTSHCEDSAQNLDQWPGVAFVAPFVPVLIAIVHVGDESAARPPRAEPSLLHSTSPPLTIRNCCLRI